MAKDIEAKKSAETSGSGLPGQMQATRLQASGSPFLALQRTLGNQAMIRLFESGGVQAKLRVSQPGDADEQEADRVAEQVVSRRSGPVLQRKCACGGTCSSCKSEEEQEQVIHRSAAAPLSAFSLSIQRAAADPSTVQPAAEEGHRHDQAKHPGERPHTVIVEDDAPSLASGQMRKTQFVSLLQSSTCATADAVLESVGHTTKGCPYIKKWLAHYKDKDAQHLTRAMHKYAPETVRARSAHEAIALVNHRVQRAALSWAKTGKVSDLPEGIQEEMGGGGGFLGALHGFVHSGFGKGLLGFLGGGKEDSGAAGKVQRKANHGTGAGAHDAAQVKEQLGSGHSLDGRVQGQMSAAFGYDFSGVRVHTDAKAGELSSQLQARAFTIGSDVAFAGGEYKPGTLVGDALIAHELAHVVQQGGGNQTGTAQSKDASLSDESSLEQDADRSAVGAVVSAWTGAKKGLVEIGANALPRLKSGLKLQRCNCNKDSGKKVTAGSGTAPSTGTAPAASATADGAKATTAYGEFEAVKYHALKEKATGTEVGVEMFMKFHPGPKVDAKQIALTQAATGKRGGTPAQADPNFGRRSATSGPGQGYFTDVLTGYPSPLYATANTPRAGADSTKLTSYPTLAASELTAPQVAAQEAATGVSGETHTGFGKHGFRYMEAGTLKGPEAAELYDNPHLGTPNDSEQIFESTALAIEGTQTDTYYGSVNWGWKRDGSGTFTMLPFTAISQGTPNVNFLTAASIFNTATEDFNWGVSAATANILDPTNIANIRATVTRGTALTWGGMHAIAGGVDYNAVVVKDGASAGTAGAIRSTDMAMMDVGRPTVHLPVPEVYKTNTASAAMVSDPTKSGTTLMQNLAKDTRLTITDATTNPDWSKIKIVDGPDTGKEGWVKKSALTREALGTH